MILVALLFSTSILALLVSLFAFGLILRFFYNQTETYEQTSSQDAILISGCDSGIGLELAKYFFRTCEFKIICCFLNPYQSDGSNELLELSKSHGTDRMIFSKLDLRSSQDVDSLVDTIKESRTNGKFKNLVALINNAGTMTYGEFDWLTWDQIDHQINVNLTGTLRLTRAILPFIIESKGRIVNVSSVNDITVFPGLTVYSATKSALSTFTRGLGYELRKFGVIVINIRLGDFARLTNIMANHESHRDDMWNEMSSKKKIIYKDFFVEFNRHLMDNYGMTSPKNFENSSLFHDFRRAILSRNPSTTITCAPISFKIFYSLMELTPDWIQYQLLDRLIQFAFHWKPPQVVST